jgi:CPA2 family monovalent cation:H+ antiporter-2
VSGDLAHHVQDLGIVLGTAAFTSLLSHRLKQPPVLGYLLAGILVGPQIPGVVIDDPGLTLTLSELGVILLMFTIGLEFSLRKIARIGVPAGLTAALEVGLMISLGYLGGRLFGWPDVQSLFLGACLAISSTMLVAKAFEEQKLRGGFVDVTFAILVFEDIIAILMLAILAAVAAGGDMSGRDLAITLGKLFGFLVAMTAGGLLVVPRFIRRVVALKRDESTLIAGIAVCFGMAAVASFAGYSVALGAFVAGMLVSESGEGPKVEHLIKPFRDVFAAIFFIAVGMQIVPSEFLVHWLPIVVCTALVLGGKFFGVSIGAFLSGNGLRPSLRAGMSLAQIGEFSLIIAGVAATTGPAGKVLFPIAVAVSLLTAVLTPVLVGRSEAAAAAIDERLPARLQTFVTFYDGWIETLRTTPQSTSTWARTRRGIVMIALEAGLLLAVLAGSDLVHWRLVEGVSHRFGLSPHVVDLSWIGLTIVVSVILFIGVLRRAASLAKLLAEAVLPTRGGDKPDLGSAPRRAFTLVLQLALGLAVGLPLVALSQPFVPPSSGLIVLTCVIAAMLYNIWRSLANLQGHVRAGSELIVAVLARQSREAGHHHHDHKAQDSLVEAQGMLPGFPGMTPVTLKDDSPAVGKTLGQLGLRVRTGAQVLAINREGAAGMVMPSPRERLQAGDVVTLAGPHEAVEQATAILLRGDSGAPTAYAAYLGKS